MEENELKSKIEELRERRRSKQEADTQDYMGEVDKPVIKREDGVIGAITMQGIVGIVIAIAYVLLSTFVPQFSQIQGEMKRIILEDFSFREALYERVGSIITELNEISPVSGEVEPSADFDSPYNGAGGEKTTGLPMAIPSDATLAGVIYTGSIEYPVSDGRVTSEFGFRSNPITGKFEFHNALDIASLHGEPVYAAANGVVSTASTNEMLGNYIILDHGNGFKTKYGHCSKLAAKEGETVKQGDVIALIGSTGDSTGPHVHFAASKNGVYFNPTHLYKYVQKWNTSDDRV